MAVAGRLPLSLAHRYLVLIIAWRIVAPQWLLRLASRYLQMQHGCLFCPKTFRNKSILLNHLNQPTGRCHHAFHVGKFARRLRRHRARGSPPPEEEQWFTDEDEDQHIATDHDFDSTPTPMEVDDPSPPGCEADSVDHTSGTCREDFPGAAKILDGGKTFLDKFYDDEYADKRVDNLYYPFATVGEWELASWLIRTNLSMAATNEFLRLRLVRSLPYKQMQYLSWVTGENNVPLVFHLEGSPQPR